MRAGRSRVAPEAVETAPPPKRSRSTEWARANRERVRAAARLRAEQRRAQAEDWRTPRLCTTCGGRFTPTRGNQASCGPTCALARERAQQRAARRATRRPSPRFALRRVAGTFLSEDLAQERALAALEGRSFDPREFWARHGYDRRRASLPEWAA